MPIDPAIFSSMQYVVMWMQALALSLAVEVPIFVVMGRARTAEPVGIRRLAVGAAFGTLVTHPLFWFAWIRLFTNYLIHTISGELLIVLVEAAIFYAVARRISGLRALIASVVANGASLLAGDLLYRLGIMG